MSLRRRLFLFVFVPIAVLYYAFGIYGVYQTRSQLIADLDDDLASTSANSADFLDPLSTEEIEALIRQTGTDSPRVTAVTEITTGNVFISPSTRTGELQSPPSEADLSAAQLANRLDTPFTLQSADGTLDYRAIATRIDGGRLVVTAQGLDRIDSLTQQFLIGTLITGLLILAAMAAVVYIGIRSGLRPLKRFIETTTRVADGDLTERVDTHQDDPGFTEIALATNHMLDQVEQSYEQQRLGRKRLNELVADAAHELRTPLTAIRGTVDMRNMGAIDTEDQLRVAFRGLDEHSQRMMGIVEDLIVIARAENMRLGAQTQTTSIVDLQTMTADLVTAFAQANPNRTIDFEATDGEHEVEADEGLLRTAITNILDNAASHTPNAAAINVALTSDDTHTHLAFTDTGPGIPNEISETVFDRFVRADTSRARTTGGAGLGLSIVESIVESAGGSVALASNSPEGCTFEITLPRYRRTNSER